jgi:hypothetical protein
VNTVLLHPHLMLAATAGVEADVLLHGATATVMDGMQRTETQTREIGQTWPEEDEDLGQDGYWVDVQRDTIRLFDRCACFPFLI